MVTNLQHLNLSCTSKLEELPPSIYEMQHLETLEMGKNSLSTLPSGIGLCPKLKTLKMER